MRCLVTGAAGFIGSHLCERLVAEGYDVVGVDAFVDQYPRWLKELNLRGLRHSRAFSLWELDLAEVDLSRRVRDFDLVFHLAGQPGVRASWGAEFSRYLRNNVLATQRLLEAVRDTRVTRFLYASSSSVYGDAEGFPTPETALTRPVSPYGMTKLTGEQLCDLYWRTYGVPVASVRYFTVYGPRQRPDMAFHRFLRAILLDQVIDVYGDGEQTRDFTYVSDAVDGTVRAAFTPETGEVFNIGSGRPTSLNIVLEILTELTGRRARVRQTDCQPGDARNTGAAIGKARSRLRFDPLIDLRTGIERQLVWMERIWLPSASAA